MKRHTVLAGVAAAVLLSGCGIVDMSDMPRSDLQLVRPGLETAQVTVTNTHTDPVSVTVQECETDAYRVIEPPLQPGETQTYTISAGCYEIWAGRGMFWLFRAPVSLEPNETLQFP